MQHNVFKFEKIEPILKINKTELSLFAAEHEDEPDSKEAMNNFFPTHTFTVTAKNNDILVGLAHCSIRDLVFMKSSISYGGVGGVVTHKNFRHLGIATKMMEYIINELKVRDIDISILCTDISKLGNLYSKVGYVPLQRPYYFLNKLGKNTKNNEGMIAPCASIEKFNLILNNPERLYIGISNF